jgi:excisionase family DNA binding protein
MIPYYSHGAKAENSMTIEEKRIYTPKEVAQLLQLAERTVLRHLKGGSIPGFKVGKRWRIYGRDLLALNKLGESEEE